MQGIGLEAWWIKFAARPFPNFKDEIKVLLESSSFKPRELRARKDRRLTWRGEEIEGGRVVAYVKVPAGQVDDYLARSGRRGIVIDRATRTEDDVQAIAKVRIPVDWTIADAIAKHDKAPAELKKQARGFVPSARGYILRVLKTAEVDFVRYFTPEVADELGPSLGMTATSTWKITGVPAAATRAMIINTFATPNGEWGGGRVMPIRPVGQPFRGKATWIVEAEAEPPKRDAIIQRACITIDRHVEPKKISPRAAPWFRIKPSQVEEQQKQQTRSIWAEEAEDDPEENQDGGEGADAGAADQGLGGNEQPAPRVTNTNTYDIDQPTNTDNEGAPTHPAPKFHRVRMANPKAAPRPPLRVAAAAVQQQPREGQPQFNDQLMEMLKQMQRQQQQQAEESAKKDALIHQLQQTIMSLQETIHSMQQAFNSSAAAATSAQPAPAGAAGHGEGPKQETGNAAW